MNILKKAVSLSLCLVMLLSVCLFAVNAEETDTKDWDRIKVFETTDVHGYLVDTSSGDESTFQYRMAYLAKVVADARKDEAYDDVMLLDGGDIYQGTPVSNLTYGNALRAAMDKMGYDAVSLGNHEFDWDVTTYAADNKGTMPAYEIGEFKGDSDIPVLAYNLYKAGTTNRADFTKDYVVLDKAGYKVAVIGYIPDYSMDIMAAKINPYDIKPEMDALKAKIAEVNKTEQPDVTVVLAHASPKSLANAMDPAQVDLVLGGHSHSASVGTAENGIAYIQGNCQAKGYATAEICVNPETKEVKVEAPSYVSTTDKDNQKNLYATEGNDKLDPEVLAISKASWDAVKDQMAEVLGTVDQSITRRVKIDGSNSTIAGNWLTGLMLEATKELETVVAFTNSGGIRCDLLMAEGAKTRDITVGDIYTITPFGNRLFTYDITGAELAQTVKNSFKNANYGDQFSGMVVTYSQAPDTKDENGRVQRGEITIQTITLSDGTKVDITDNTKTYRVCVNEYCATLPGSVFEKKTPVQDVNEAPIDNLSAIEALRAQGKANGGKLPLDVTPHCVKVEAPKEDVCVAFADVDTSSWYHDGIHFAIEEGILQGFEDKTMRPDAQLTRAMVVTMLYRMSGSEKVEKTASFTDVPEKEWYTDAVAWAAEEEYVLGYEDKTFRPERNITREELATILYRFAEDNGYDMTAKGDLTKFTDSATVSSYAKDSLTWAVGVGLVKGMEKNTLQPQGLATRAQYATLMLRLSELAPAEK